MVRLKVIAKLYGDSIFQVSIPYGTIESNTFNARRKNCDVSIPYGTIESKR